MRYLIVISQCFLWFIMCFKGMEAGCVILILNLGNIDESLSTGLSRAQSRLVVFSPLDRLLEDAIVEANRRNLVSFCKYSLINVKQFCSKVDVDTNILHNVRHRNVTSFSWFTRPA